MESKIWHKWNYLQNRLTNIKNRLVIAKGEGGGRGKDWEFEISRCKLLYIGWINNKVPLYITRNYISCDKPYWKRILKKECRCVCNWITLLYSRDWHNIVYQLQFLKMAKDIWYFSKGNIQMWHFSKDDIQLTKKKIKTCSISLIVRKI